MATLSEIYRVRLEEGTVARMGEIAEKLHLTVSDVMRTSIMSTIYPENRTARLLMEKIRAAAKELDK